MPTGASHHFDGLQDGPNVNDENLNSLDAGGNVHPVLGALAVNVEPAVFNSSALVAEIYPGASAVAVPGSATTMLWLVPGGPPTLAQGAAFPGTEHCPLAEVDTDGVQVIAVRDRRPKLSSLVGGGPPTGPAGGDLAGTYPNPDLAAGAIVNADVNAAAAIDESKLALNFPTHSNANDPTAGEKAALAGTGVPSGLNPYVNDDDARLADARTPTAHAATHQHAGGDEIGVTVAAANAIPKALGTGKLDNAWINRQVRGDDLQFLTDEARTTTVAGPGAPALKLQLLTGVLTGTYRIYWQAEVDNNNLVRDGVVRLYNVTDALVLDSHGYGARALPAAQPRRAFGMVTVVLSGASKTIEIQHYDQAGGNTQGIAKARLEFFRVA